MGFLRPFRKKCIAPVSSPSTFEDLSLEFSFLFIFSPGLLLFLPFLMVNKGALIPITKTWICDPIRKRWTAEIYWYVGIGECGVRGWALMPHANASALFLFYFCVFLPPLSANAFSKKCISTHKKKVTNKVTNNPEPDPNKIDCLRRIGARDFIHLEWILSTSSRISLVNWNIRKSLFLLFKT